MLTILYHARAAYGRSNEQGQTIITDLVQVTLRQWVAEDARDVVLRATVLVDAEIVVDSCKCLDPDLSDKSLKRAAAAEFQDLLTSHPTDLSL